MKYSILSVFALICLTLIFGFTDPVFSLHFVSILYSEDSTTLLRPIYYSHSNNTCSECVGLRYVNLDDEGLDGTFIILNTVLSKVYTVTQVGVGAIEDNPYTPNDSYALTFDGIWGYDYVVHIVDTTPPVVSSYLDENGVITATVSDVESGVNPYSVTLALDGTPVTPIIIGTPLVYKLTYDYTDNFDTATISASSFYYDPAGLYSAQSMTRNIEKGTTILLDSDGDSVADSSDADDDNDGTLDVSDTYRTFSLLKAMDGVESADSNSNGLISNEEKLAYVTRFTNGQYTALWVEMLAVLVWTVCGEQPSGWAALNTLDANLDCYAQYIKSTSGGGAYMRVKE